MVAVATAGRFHEHQAALVILDRLCQTTTHCISLLETWLSDTRDPDVRTGLQSHLIEERRHLRLISDEVKRLGGTPSGSRPESTIGRAFGLAKEQKRDVVRLCLLYRGVKGPTLARCNQLMHLVSPDVARLLDQIGCDEDRQIRWAEIRIARETNAAQVRESGATLERVSSLVDGSWQKVWFDLVRSRR